MARVAGGRARPVLGSCGKKRRLGREVCASWGRPSANSEDRSKSPSLKITMLTTWREDGQGGSLEAGRPGRHLFSQLKTVG